MQALFKIVAAAEPGTLLAWVNQWMDLLSATILVRPSASDQIHSTAAGLSTVLAFIIASIWRDEPTARLRRRCALLCAAIGAVVMLILLSRYMLMNRLSREMTLDLYYIWDILYILLVVVVVLALLSAILMYINREDST